MHFFHHSFCKFKRERSENVFWGSLISTGSCLRVPNGVFQTVFFRFLTLAGDRGNQGGTNGVF